MGEGRKREGRIKEGRRREGRRREDGRGKEGGGKRMLRRVCVGLSGKRVWVCGRRGERGGDERSQRVAEECGK
jgi:hypothetical protein